MPDQTRHSDAPKLNDKVLPLPMQAEAFAFVLR